MSDFWYYVIVIAVIAHVIGGFVFVAIKLTPKKKKKQ